MRRSLDVPAERDVPPERLAHMRAELVTALGRSPARPMRLRVAATAAAVAAVAGALLLAMPDDREPDFVLAMGPGELTPSLRPEVEQCLQWNQVPGSVPVSPSDLAVAAQHGDLTVLLFLTDTGYLACDMWAPRGRERSAATTGATVWPHGNLLPGPVDRLLLSSTELDGGAVAASGRVSARVDRLVLEHGNGQTSTARLANGAFGLVSEGDDVQADAELVSYDASGREIDRRPLFEPLDRLDRCYTDPSGAVIFGRPGPDCRPAEEWSRD